MTVILLSWVLVLGVELFSRVLGSMNELSRICLKYTYCDGVDRTVQRKFLIVCVYVRACSHVLSLSLSLSLARARARARVCVYV